MRTKLAVHMMKVEIPEEVIDELNDHIDNVNIPQMMIIQMDWSVRSIVIKNLHN